MQLRLRAIRNKMLVSKIDNMTFSFNLLKFAECIPMWLTKFFRNLQVLVEICWNFWNKKLMASYTQICKDNCQKFRMECLWARTNFLTLIFSSFKRRDSLQTKHITFFSKRMLEVKCMCKLTLMSIMWNRTIQSVKVFFIILNQALQLC